MKKIFSIILAIAMLVGVLAVSDYQKRARAAEQVVWAEDFDDKESDMLFHAGNVTQTILEDSGNDTPYLKFGTSGWSVIKTPVIAVEAGKTYQLSYKIKVENVVPSMYIYAHLQEWQSGNNLNEVFYSAEAITANTDGWKSVTVEYTPAAGRNQVQFYFEDAGWGGSADIYLDDITLTEVSEASAPSNKADITIGFDCVTSAGDWNFLPKTTMPQNAPQYYTATIKVDGADRKVLVEYIGGKFWIYSWVFAANEGMIPSETVVIPEGTILYESDSGNVWNVATDPMEITITNTTKVSKTQGGDWTSSVAPQATKDTELQYNKINGKDWYLTSKDKLPQEMNQKYFVTNIWVDGAERKVVIEYNGADLIIWEGFFGGAVPTESLEIPSGTVLYETNPNNAAWPIIEGGCRITTTKVLKVLNKGTSGWMEDVEAASIYETALNYKNEDANNWYFSAVTALPPLEHETAYQYYVTKIKVDGVERQVVIEYNGIDLVIWEGFLNGEAPAKSLEITKDTILYETNPNVIGWPIQAGGKQIKITENLKLVKDDAYKWLPATKAEATYNVTLDFNKIDSDQSWHLTTKNTLPKATNARYFFAIVKIDGKDTKIALENSAEDATKLIIWPSFFEVSGGAIPTKNFKIPAGTVFYEIDSIGWNIVSGGTQIVVKNELVVKKDSAGNWLADVEPEAVIKTELKLEKINAQGAWYVSSSKTLPSVAKAKFFTTTIKIDGKLTKIALENDGTNLIVWPDFYKVYGGKVPTKSVVIPKGTVLYEISDADWSMISGGTQIVVSKQVNILNDEEETWGVGAVKPPQEEKDTLNFVRCDFMSVEDWQTGDGMKSGSFSVQNGILKGTVAGNSSGKTLLSFTQDTDKLALEPGEKYKVIMTYKSRESFGTFMNLRSNAWTEAPGVCEASEGDGWKTISGTFKAIVGETFSGALLQSWNTGGEYELQIKDFCIARVADTKDMTKGGSVGTLPKCESLDDALGRYVYEWVLRRADGNRAVLTDGMSLQNIRSLSGGSNVVFAYEQIKCVYHMDDGVNYGKAATARKAGWEQYWVCATCGKMFSDEMCKHEIKDLDAWKKGVGKIAPTGHETTPEPDVDTAVEVEEDDIPAGVEPKETISYDWIAILAIIVVCIGVVVTLIMIKRTKKNEQ